MRQKRRGYAEESELRRYIWCNYNHALTKREHSIRVAAILELKAQATASELSATHFRQMPGYFFDEDVAGIVKDGITVFDQRCCDRLLRDYATQIYINRCVRCQRIVASPIACACVWCGHSWFDLRSEIVARAKSSIYPNPDETNMA